MRTENQEALRRFNSDWDNAHSTDDTKPPIEVSEGGSADNLMASIAASNVNAATTPYAPPPIPTTGDTCNQCNLLHPPVPPGETCPNAPSVQKDTPTKEVTYEALTEGDVQQSPANFNTPRPTSSPPSPITTTEQVIPEPSSLADNNIPTEIHVNKYLASWGEMIRAHCTSQGVINVKKLMRHLTVEVTDFLESYKGK